MQQVDIQMIQIVCSFEDDSWVGHVEDRGVSWYTVWETTSIRAYEMCAEFLHRNGAMNIGAGHEDW